MIPVIEENGKKVFIGQEDPSNPPIFVRNPLKRYCSKNHENDNDQVYCTVCQEMINDGKMQCQTCKRFFDFLVGEDSGGGKQGCEGCYKPPVRKVQNETETPSGEVFN